MSDTRTAEIRMVAGQLLEEGKVDLFIGFQQGTVPLRSRPGKRPVRQNLAASTWRQCRPRHRS